MVRTTHVVLPMYPYTYARVWGMVWRTLGVESVRTLSGARQMTLVFDRPVATVPLGHDGDDIACWTRRWQDGHVETWRAAGLADSILVAVWASGVLSPDCRYADLLFRELARLT